MIAPAAITADTTVPISIIAQNHSVASAPTHAYRIDCGRKPKNVAMM